MGEVFKLIPVAVSALGIIASHYAWALGSFEALVDDPRIVVPMCGIIGTERVSIFTDKMNLKRPREGSRFNWHQDSP